MIICSSFTDWINQVLACMGGCLGCYSKPTPVTSMDGPSKRLQAPWQTAKRASGSEDFWSTSTHELENSALQSHRSISSITLSNQSLNPNGGSDGISSNSEFVNHGLIHWNQARLQWTTSERSDNCGRVRRHKLSSNVSYERLLGSSRRFSQAVPLSEMVDYLVEIWENEGLYY